MRAPPARKAVASCSITKTHLFRHLLGLLVCGKHTHTHTRAKPCLFFWFFSLSVALLFLHRVGAWRQKYTQQQQRQQEETEKARTRTSLRTIQHCRCRRNHHSQRILRLPLTSTVAVGPPLSLNCSFVSTHKYHTIQYNTIDHHE